MKTITQDTTADLLGRANATGEEPFGILVRVKIKPDGVKNFEAASGLAVTATRKEKGNVAYELRRDLEEAGTYFFVEKWRSSAALEEHLKSEYIKTLLATLDEVATEAPSARFTTAPAEAK